MAILDDLELAVTVSQAAYGYAMAAGHLDTIENCIAMHTIHVQHFDPVAGASVDANLDAVHRYTGYRKEDIIAYDWSNREFRPCYFLALDRERRRIVLAIRGSMEKGDVVTDVSGAPLTVEIDGISGNVHEGSMAAAIYVHSKTATLLKGLVDQHPGWSVFVTGHSIGGGVAACLAMILKFEDPLPSPAGSLKCISVGSAAVMSENLGELCKDFVTSLVFRYDVIPRLSAYSIEAMMVELVQASPAKRTVDAVIQSATSAVQTFKRRWSQFIDKSDKQRMTRVQDLHDVCRLAEDEAAVRGARHAVEHLDDKLDEDRVGRDAVESVVERWGPVRSFVPLYPPGKVVWLLGSKSEGKEGIGRSEPWWGPLHNWSLEKIEAVQKTTAYRRKLLVDLDGLLKGFLGMNEKVSKDIAWLKDWLYENVRTNNDMDVQSTVPREAHEETSPGMETGPRTLASEMNERTSGVGTQSTSKSVMEEKAVDRKDRRVRLMLIEAERKTFGRLLLHPMMLQDHLPRSYFEAIKELKTAHEEI